MDDELCFFDDHFAMNNDETYSYQWQPTAQVPHGMQHPRKLNRVQSEEKNELPKPCQYNDNNFGIKINNGDDSDGDGGGDDGDVHWSSSDTHSSTCLKPNVAQKFPSDVVNTIGDGDMPTELPDDNDAKINADVHGTIPGNSLAEVLDKSTNEDTNIHFSVHKNTSSESVANQAVVSCPSDGKPPSNTNHDATNTDHDVTNTNHGITNNDVINTNQDVTGTSYDVIKTNHNFTSINYDATETKHDVTNINHDVTNTNRDITNDDITNRDTNNNSDGNSDTSNNSRTNPITNANPETNPTQTNLNTSPGVITKHVNFTTNSNRQSSNLEEKTLTHSRSDGLVFQKQRVHENYKNQFNPQPVKHLGMRRSLSDLNIRYSYTSMETRDRQTIPPDMRAMSESSPYPNAIRAMSESCIIDEGEDAHVDDVYWPAPPESSDSSEDECPVNPLSTFTGPTWTFAKRVEECVRNILSVKTDIPKVEKLISEDLCKILYELLDHGLKKNFLGISLFSVGSNVWSICQTVSKVK